MTNQKIKVTKNLFIEIVQAGSDTEIYLNEFSEQRILYIYENNETVSYHILYDDTYIVVYSKNKHNSLKLEVAYNHQTKRILNLNNDKLRSLLEHRFILKQCFDLRVVLSFINKVDLRLLSHSDELTRFKNYLTSNNPQVSHEEIINYIIKKYPILKKYNNLPSPPYVADYLKILEDIGHDSLFFHTMPIKFQENSKIRLKEPNNY